MDAIVTVEFRIPNVCNKGDPESCDQTFKELVEYLIEVGGLFGLVEDTGRIINIKEQETTP